MSTFVPCETQNRNAAGGGFPLTPEKQAIASAASPLRNMEARTTTNGSLFGRSKEVNILTSICKQVSEPGAPSQVVFLRGESGVGKSALFYHFERTMTSEDAENPYIIFACGKFDQLRSSAPYSAIVRCFEAVCDGILNSRNRTELCRQIREELEGDDTRLLTKVIPKVSYIVGFRDEGQQDQIKASAQAFAKFKILCRNFLRAVSSKSPVVLFLDDLQWADSASLGVLKDLMKDAGSSNALIVSAYRDDERGTVIPMMELEVKRASKLSVTDLPIRNLELEEINDMLATLLESTRDATFRLSELVLRKTSGNPYFMIQYLELLYAENLLTQGESGGWLWNTDRVRAETYISDNVLTVVTARIGRLHPTHQQVLHFASCLGFDFDIRILGQVYKEEHRSDLGGPSFESDVLWREKVVSALSAAVRERLLEKKTAVCYRFSHDRVQQCMYEMIGEARGVLHAKIGRILLASSSSDSHEVSESAKQHQKANDMEQKKDGNRDTRFLLAVDQLNRGSMSITNEEGSLELVRYNVHAGKIAVETKTAFDVGANYFRAAISTYGKDWLWADHYSVAYEAHMGLAECYRNMGDLEQCLQTVKDIVDNARSLQDQVTAHIVLIEALDYQDERAATLELSLSTLALLGHPLPKKANLFRVIVSVFGFKRKAEKLTDEHWLSLPEMTDKLLLAEMKVLGIIVTTAFVSEGAMSLFPLCVVRILKRTLEHGLCTTSCFAMSSLSLLVSSFGDIDSATRYGRLAVKFSTLPLTEKSWQARTINTVLSSADHWRASYHELAPKFYSNYKQSLMAGDIEASMHAAIAHAGMANYVRSTLQEKADRCREFIQTMHDYSIFALQDLVYLELQSALNLMGESPDPLILTGEAFVEADMSDSFITRALFLFLKSFIGLHLRNSDLVVEMITLLRRGKQSVPSHFSHVNQVAIAAVACYEKYRHTKKRKYISWARGYERELTKLSNQGAITASALLLLVQAEFSWTHNSKKCGKRCKEKYDAAVVAFRDLDLLSYEAMANDRAARAMLKVGETRVAKGFMASALDSYRRWGATAKVSQLEDEHNAMFGVGLC